MTVLLLSWETHTWQTVCIETGSWLDPYSEAVSNNWCIPKWTEHIVFMNMIRAEEMRWLLKFFIF